MSVANKIIENPPNRHVELSRAFIAKGVIRHRGGCFFTKIKFERPPSLSILAVRNCVPTGS